MRDALQFIRTRPAEVVAIALLVASATPMAAWTVARMIAGLF